MMEKTRAAHPFVFGQRIQKCTVVRPPRVAPADSPAFRGDGLRLLRRREIDAVVCGGSHKLSSAL